LKSRSCLCGVKFTFEHFLSCPTLGVNLLHALAAQIGNQDWRGSAVILLSRFEVFIHAIRDGELRAEEDELFCLLNAQVAGNEPSIWFDSLFS
jgi:hypothetical protein